MEDELEDRVIYQTYVTHLKMMSRFAWGAPLNINFHSPLTYLAYLWRLLKVYVFKPEVFIFGTIIVLIFMYLQALDVWSRALLGRLQFTISRGTKGKIQKLSLFNTGDAEKTSWQLQLQQSAAYAIQGRRPKMEDRFVINENINNTGVSLFAIFDGHGGEFAANYAKEKLIPNLYKKVVEIKDLISGKVPEKNPDEQQCKEDSKDESKPSTPMLQERKRSIRKTTSTTDECYKGIKEITDKEILSKLDKQLPVTREVRNTSTSMFKQIPTTSYFDKSGKVDYGKLLTDEVLAADRLLLEIAKKSYDVAGTTALIAILEGTKLYVANVGDSRGVMCDNKGNAIPLSFDHKPQQMRERKRIKEAGGFVSFNGVWRVAGILATSRALGDYPLKDKNFVIADPDILTFDLYDHKPQFIILASDGLWDTFSNEDAIAFIKERLDESDYGARSITLESLHRGSLDNITVVIIDFRNFPFKSAQA
ncbi:protein phosphatase 1L [Agrilus planipennis]|uniref:Protein phosphatase 1L n=1 Tax=Agrilus planipennis TaxID=224129 RepID=A0A1W4X9I7_AGRPL|nr:protein phosphatase 1L [Agrilus planipennis]